MVAKSPDVTWSLDREIVLSRVFEAPRALVYEAITAATDERRFRVTITFDEQADKKTVVTMRQLLATKEQRAATIGFGAVEIGYGTLDNLAAYLRKTG
jgi:uncharacterized protein YndB with AHSA1/START domain